MSRWSEDGWTRAVPPLQVDRAALDALLGPLGPCAGWRRLSLGKANTNLRVERRHGPPLVVRVYQRDAHALAREKALWSLVDPLVPVPALRREGRVAGAPAAVLDFIHGTHPAHAMATAPQDAQAIGHALGSTLARLGAVAVDGVGRYAPDLTLARRFDSVAHSFEDLMRWSLRRGRARKRLGPERRRALLHALPLALERLAPLEDHPGLAHGDYKSSNLLLVRDEGWRVAAVLDWELAAPFTPMLDVALLMRHRDALPTSFQDGFAAGYRSGGAWLPDDWRAVSRVVDLMSLIGLLNASTDRPRLYAAAVQRVDATLAMLQPRREVLPNPYRPLVAKPQPC